MSLSQSSAANSQAAHSVFPHVHAAGEACPFCEQPIPHDRFDEIKERIETRQAANDAELTARLQERFTRQTADAVERERQLASAQLEASVASARREERESAELAASQKLAAAEEVRRTLQAQLDQTQLDSETAIEKVRQEADANAATIREESKKQAEADAQQLVADLRIKHQQTEISLRSLITQADDARNAAERSRADLLTQLDQARRAHESAVELVRQESEATIAGIRSEALSQAQAEVKDQIGALERSWQESESAYQGRIRAAEQAKLAAEQSSGELRALVDQVRADGQAAIERVTQDADARVLTARREAALAAENASQLRIADAEQARATAEAKTVFAEDQNKLLQEAHGVQLEERLKELREAMAGEQISAVNAERSAAFEKELKLSTKVEELQRALDSKTNEELGEGAEIELYDELRGQFDGDKIERINPGQPGADILHTVVHNGRECGSIIYDSKNHNAWRNEFVTKLAADQMHAKADHAILSTRKFPKGARHLHVQDGVILAAPSRVAALVQIIRQHIISMHTSRLSDEARSQKTAELYALINSGRFRDILKRIDTNAEKLLDLQLREKKAHDALWKTQGELLRSIQRVHAEVTNEIDMIIGTAGETQDRAVHE
jgi:hypothetical protein